MTDEELDAIEARAAAATPGPWEPTRDGSLVMDSETDLFHVFPHTRGPDDPLDFSVQKPNAAFIAHAREDVPNLVAEVRMMRAQREADMRAGFKIAECLAWISTKNGIDWEKARRYLDAAVVKMNSG